MKTATGLGLIAFGAILAFAITAQPSFLNLHVAGWVIILTGLAGLAIPRRGYGWLRRRTVIRRLRDGRVRRVEQRHYPPYVMLNPASPAVAEETAPGPGRVGVGAESAGAAAEGPATAPYSTVPDEPLPGEISMGSVRRDPDLPPTEETVEEFIQE